MIPTRDADMFPAILKNTEGEIIAEGHGNILVSTHAVNFTSDFVPLYPIGTPMEIDRIFEDKEVHRFVGKVFLSDRTLLRLVCVDDELLPGSEYVYCGGMSFPAHIKTIVPPPPKKPRFRLPFRHEPVPILPIEMAATIVSLTDRQLEIKVAPPEEESGIEGLALLRGAFQNGALLVLTLPNTLFAPDDPTLPTTPPIPETIIRVEKQTILSSETSCLCRFSALSARDRLPLTEFLIRYNLSRNKLF